MGHLDALTKPRLKLLTQLALKAEIVVILKWIAKVCGKEKWKRLPDVFLRVGQGDFEPLKRTGNKGIPPGAP